MTQKTTEHINNRIQELENALTNPSITLESLGLSNQIPQELKDLRDTYFTYYTPQNLQIIQASNNNPEELQFFKSLVENADKITPVLQKYNVTASPNGFFFRKDLESVFANLMGRLYADRKVQKKLLAEAELKKANGDNSQEVLDAITYHDLMQGSVLKILLNSAYGSCALDYNPFSFGKSMAAAITTTGRFANRMVAYNVNSKLKDLSKSKQDIERVPYTIQADTDSNYFNFEPLVKLKYPDGVTSKEAGLETCKNIADKIVDPVIKATTSNIATILNAYSPEVLDMEMETIADIFVSVADKRYFCRYYKKEESKYKITGLSLIGKSTPAYCKVALKPILELVADKDSKAIIDYMETVKEGFISAPLKDVCTIKGVSAIDYFQEGEKFYKFSQETGRKNPAPFHSRGSIIHNMLLDKEGDTQNTRIRAGDKVYILPLKIPNPAFNQNVICFINPKVIEEHGLMKYVDYDIMFEKNFKKNIQLITEPIGWNLDPYQGVLDEWE